MILFLKGLGDELDRSERQSYRPMPSQGRSLLHESKPLRMTDSLQTRWRIAANTSSRGRGGGRRRGRGRGGGQRGRGDSSR